VFLNAFEPGSEARFEIGRWIGHYDGARPRPAFGGRTPDEVYAIEHTTERTEKLAA
jgi:putative transposase